jgi:copper(I)-binding protein
MRSFLVTVLTIMPFAAFADEAAIHVDHAWSRAAMAGHNGVVYLTITDTGLKDTLTGVATPVADNAELHQSVNDHGVMKMRPVADLSIEPGKPVTLSPGGYHIMLIGLKQALKKDESFPITLTFTKAGAVTAIATVQPSVVGEMHGQHDGSMTGMHKMGEAQP